MVPYREVTHEKTGKTILEPWPTIDANRVLHRIEQEVIAELTAKARKKAKNADQELYGDWDGVTVSRYDGESKEFVVDSFLARCKPSGAEVIDETRKRYAAFCSKTQELENPTLQKYEYEPTNVRAIPPYIESDYVEHKPVASDELKPRRAGMAMA